MLSSIIIGGGPGGLGPLIWAAQHGLLPDWLDRGVAVGDTGHILSSGAIMLALSLVQVGCAAGATYFGAQAAMAFGRDLRRAIVSQVASFSAREVGKFGPPSLITRTTNDVQQVQTLVLMTCTMLIAAPIMCIGGLVMALREDLELSRLLLEESQLDPALEHTHTFYEGVGCIECNGTGYKGRMAICELLNLSDRIREMILEKRPTSEIKKTAREEGMRFLRESAVERVLEGITTLREINKVTFVE